MFYSISQDLVCFHDYPEFKVSRLNKIATAVYIYFITFYFVMVNIFT